MTDTPVTPQRARDRDKRAIFIATLRNTANVRASAQAAGITRVTAYRWKEKSTTFAAEWEDALEDACDTLEAAAWKRARDGVAKPVFQQGEHVGDVQEYSDTLMVFLLKAHRPGKYRETIRQEFSGPNGNAIEVKATDYRAAIAPLAPAKAGSVGDSETSGED